MTKDDFMCRVTNEFDIRIGILRESLLRLVDWAYEEGFAQGKNAASSASDNDVPLKDAYCPYWYKEVVTDDFGNPIVTHEKCYGTRERDACACGGLQSKCSFYKWPYGERKR